MATNKQKPKLMVENISCVLPQTNSLGGVFLGNVYGAQNPQILKEYGIRAVLTTSIETPIQYKKEDIPFHLVIQAHDKDDFSIIESLDQCIEFIHQYRNYTNVLVHCYAGVSRSATVIIAYLMKKLKWNLLTSLQFVKCKRIVAKPNDGFMSQLSQYEKMLKRDLVVSNNTHSLQNLSLNVKVQTNQQKVVKEEKIVQGEKGVISSKRHKQTPLPKILTMKAQSIPKYGMGKQPQQKEEKVNMNVKKAGMLLRPKDLPGYKNF